MLDGQGIFIGSVVNRPTDYKSDFNKLIDNRPKEPRSIRRRLDQSCVKQAISEKHDQDFKRLK